MQKANHLQGKWWQNAVFLFTALSIVAADQLSKVWIRSNLAIGESLFEVGFFRIIRVPPNTGAAFGLFQDQSFALTIVAIIGIALLLVYAFILHRHFPLLNKSLIKLTLGLILGGTAGNLIDRLNPNLGGVTDFISIGIWPAFNVADSGIVVGTIIFVYSFLSSARTEKH